MPARLPETFGTGIRKSKSIGMGAYSLITASPFRLKTRCFDDVRPFRA